MSDNQRLQSKHLIVVKKKKKKKRELKHTNVGLKIIAEFC